MTVRLRPTFSTPTSRSVDETIIQIRNCVRRFPGEFSGQFRTGHAVISVVESKRHFWSPWLHLDIRETESGRQLFGRFSPHPTVWTGFVFAYLVLGILVFFSSIIGVSQQLASQYPWGYFVVPVCLSLGAVLWLASQVGQRLAHEQMISMKQLVEDAMADEKLPEQ